MALPATTRARLRELLNIPKTGQTDVSTDGSGTSTLLSDGVSAKDLETITTKLLQEFTGSDELEFPRLWTIAVRKADLTLSEIKPGIVVDKPVSTGDNGALVIENEKSISEESK